MFGMDDPAKVVVQIRNYVIDGRMEIAEVMAGELSTMLLADSGRDHVKQAILVDALRQSSTILHARGKHKEALKACKQLQKQRDRLPKMQIKSGFESNVNGTQVLLDEMERGHVLRSLGKLGPAASAYSMGMKLGYVEAHLSCMEAHEACKGSVKKAKKVALSMANAVRSTLPISRSGDGFVLEAGEGLSTSVERIITCIDRWLQPTASLHAKAAEELTTIRAELVRQRDQIMSGEQAANARLQAAIDSLQPTVDYHEYSQGNS